MQYTYGDIPDSIPSKRFFPLGEHLWRLCKNLGWEFFFKQINDETIGFTPNLAEAVNEKFKTAVDSARKVINGKISNPETVFTTWFFPPLIYVRSDLQTGTTKLIYGNSTDISFLVVNDSTSEIDLLINGHMEDGIPVDYWNILGDDEIFDRRHMKLGVKLREIPKKTNDFVKCGFRVLEVLRDVRNERAPQFAQSAYSICMLWVSAGINMTCEPSNYGDIADVWDGISSKRFYGMHDHWFCYVPWPPLLNLMINMGRYDWTIKMTGLLTNHHLFIDAFEPKHMTLFKEDSPEFWDFIVSFVKEVGVATPYMTLNCNPPDLKDNKKFKKEEFDWKYPNGSRIMPYEWELSDEEVFSGILTNINHETPSKEFYGKEHIISMGIGK